MLTERIKSHANTALYLVDQTIQTMASKPISKWRKTAPSSTTSIPATNENEIHNDL